MLTGRRLINSMSCYRVKRPKGSSPKATMDKRSFQLIGNTAMGNILTRNVRESWLFSLVLLKTGKIWLSPATTYDVRVGSNRHHTHKSRYWTHCTNQREHYISSLYGVKCIDKKHTLIGPLLFAETWKTREHVNSDTSRDRLQSPQKIFQMSLQTKPIHMKMYPPALLCSALHLHIDTHSFNSFWTRFETEARGTSVMMFCKNKNVILIFFMSCVRRTQA